MSDRYELAREFALQSFEMEVMQMNDLFEVQCIAVKLYAQVLSQRKVYEALLKDAKADL